MKLIKRAQVIIEADTPEGQFRDALYFDTQAEADDDVKVVAMASERVDKWVADRVEDRVNPKTALPPTVDDVLNIYADAKSKLTFVQERMKEPLYFDDVKLLGVKAEVNAALKAVDDAGKSPAVNPK